MQYSITTISYTASPARLEQMFWLFPSYVCCKPAKRGDSQIPCSHNCDRGQDLHRQFFTVWLLTAQNLGILTVDCNLWPLRYISHAVNAVSGTCGSRRELVLLHLWLHCGNKSVSIGLLLVLCMYNLFSATGPFPGPWSYSLVSQQARKQWNVECAGAVNY